MKKIFLFVFIILILSATSCKNTKSSMESPVKSESTLNLENPDQTSTEIKAKDINRIGKMTTYKNEDNTFQISTDLNFLKGPKDESGWIDLKADDESMAIVCQQYDVATVENQGNKNLNDFIDGHINNFFVGAPQYTAEKIIDVKISDNIDAKQMAFTVGSGNSLSKAIITYFKTDKYYYAILTSGLQAEFDNVQENMKAVPYTFKEIQ